MDFEKVLIMLAYSPWSLRNKRLVCVKKKKVTAEIMGNFLPTGAQFQYLKAEICPKILL